MKLWDVVAVCVVLLSKVSTSPLPAGKTPPEGPPSVVEGPEDDHSPISLPPPYAVQSDSNMPEDYPDQFDNVVDFIQATIKRLRRSPDKQTPIFSKRERSRQNAAVNTENSSKKGRRGQKGKNRGCVLTEIHLNVTDLDLGYETKEELIFRYCSGSCDAAETTYDKILKNLTRKKKLVNDKVRQACCRPTAYDDDLSFLDDNLVYHILKKHSAKRCGCV
ncbi:glial cell line-derived neurotrophic factor isoform X1 [Mauremys reevesii]|uniref:glial cell line-derived neurotrophic factor isoform X1 n=1 Tax=Mauremys reevesii TaxID=260615 RepID=UPI00193F5AB5|nr:glial cell line-derived neurotrophic factor isoform X1 [Mauremys reevesii]XP_039401637.1 glial cell line-derived neurotrophic factor isoform X1 [Mauremys reevesii]